MTKTKADRWNDVHAEALREFDQVQAAVRDERMQCLSDRRFYSISGAQWEDSLGDQFANKPRFEFNMVHLAVIRIFNEYRNNRITVDFTSKDGTPNDDLADTCAGLYRADEKACTADEAYDNAFEEGVGGGFAAWRVRAAYEDEDDDENEQQKVCIEPIFDADSCVFFDLNAKRQDKSDATKCWVLTAWTRDAYEDEYGDMVATWPKSINNYQFDWCTPDVVYVCEFFKIETYTETIHVYRGLDGQERRLSDADIKDDPDQVKVLEVTGFREVRQKKATRKRVHKWILSGGGILSDEGIIAGKNIPIVPFFGKRWYVDGIERCMGHVRLAKDAQRLYNMLLSWLAELSVQFKTEKPIFTPEQVLNHSKMWAEDNVQNFPYMLADAITDKDGNAMPAGPIGYTKAPNIPPAVAALMQIAQQALSDLLGNQEAGEQLQPNMSGKAVELIQTRLDMQVYIYMSNFAKAMKRCGEIWLDIKKTITVEEGRQMKTITADGTMGSVKMLTPTIDQKTGEQYMENDLTKADFDVDVDVGPSSSSKRSATVRAITGLMGLTQDPQMQQALGLAAIANIEGEGLGDLQAWARKQGIQLGVIKPTDEETQEMQAAQAQQGQQPPDPQAQYLQAAADEATGAAALNRAKTVDTIADANLKNAQAEKVQSETHANAVATASDATTAHVNNHIAIADAMQRAANPPVRSTT
jgi:hypothetical protein